MKNTEKIKKISKITETQIISVLKSETKKFWFLERSRLLLVS